MPIRQQSAMTFINALGSDPDVRMLVVHDTAEGGGWFRMGMFSP